MLDPAKLTISTTKRTVFSLYCYVEKENILHTGTMKQALTVNRHGKMALRLRDILKYYVNQNNKLT